MAFEVKESACRRSTSHAGSRRGRAAVVVHRTLRALGALGAVATLSLVGACTTLSLPERFLVVEDSIDGFKAITPDESKVWARSFVVEGGDLAFWTESLERDLTANRGYVLIEKRDVTGTKGQHGTELLCETQSGGRPVRYLITVFVAPLLFGGATVSTVEYLADKDVFAENLDDVRAAITAAH